MKKIMVPILTVFVFMQAYSQKQKFDIASFTAPQGWQRMDSNGIVLFMDSKTANDLTSFCQIFIYPSVRSSGTASADFQSEWAKHVVKATSTEQVPKTETQKSPEGWEVTTGYANVNHMGITYTCILVTASGFGKAMSVLVNVAGESYTTAVQKFLDDFDLDSKAAQASVEPDHNNTTGNTNASTAALQEYSYTIPEGWFTQKNNNAIVLSQVQSPEWGCLITMLPPQPSSGNLEEDTRAVFNKLYAGWEYRNTADQKEDASRGHTLQGLEYYMIEAPMQKKRPDGYYYDYENAQILVVGLGNKQEAVIVARHQRGEMTCFCKYRYDYWNRFFNSFTVNNVPASKPDATSDAKKIVGSWKAMGGNALTQYIFAGNGRYQFIGAYTSTTRISWNTIEMKTSGFKGDGSYSLKGNKLTTRKDSDKSADVEQYRFEQVNHGGTGWKDRLYLLGSYEGKPYEVGYERELRE
jgi:hypothetical protein